MSNYDNKTSDEKSKKTRNMIIKIIVIIVIILLLLIGCTSGAFGKIGSILNGFSEYFLKNGRQDTTVIYDEDLRFVTDTGSTNVDDVYRIEFSTGELGTNDYMCSTSDLKVATCIAKNGYVEVYPKSSGKVRIMIIAETNGRKYIGRHYLNIKKVTRKLVLKDVSGSVSLSEGDQLMIPIELTNLNSEIKVTSGNKNIAEGEIINNMLVVTGKANGKTTITVYTTYNGKKYEQTFEVVISKKEENKSNSTNNTNNNNNGNNNSNGNNNGNQGGNGSIVHLSDENRLSSLSFNNLKLNSSFDKNKFSYTSSVGSGTSSTKLTIKKMDNNSKVYYYLNGQQITNTNNIPLIYGDNVIIIRVVSESGISRDYKVTINRSNESKPEDNKSSDSSLSLLNLSNGSLTPAFNKKTFDYKSTVSYDITTVTVNYVKSDSKATVSFKFNNKTVTSLKDLKLNVGNNTVGIIVNAEDGTKSTYTILINRKDTVPGPEVSSDNYLKTLSVDGGVLKPSFNKNTTSYKVSVDAYTKKISIDSEKNDSKANVTYTFNGNKVSNLNDLKLNIGDNIVVITVKAENGDKKEYSILVNRSDYDTNNKLSSIEFSDRNFKDFDPNINNYNIKVDSRLENITMSVKKPSKAIVKYYVNDKEVDSLNDISLNSKNTIVKIAVISEKESLKDEPVSNDYIIKITKPVVMVELLEENVSIYMEDLVNGKYNLIYKIYEDGDISNDYDFSKVGVNIPDFKGSYNVKEGYIEIMPTNDDIGNSYNMKVSYHGKSDTLTFDIKMKDYYINTSTDKYYIDCIDGIGSKPLILNTNIFNKDITYEERGNDLVLYSSIGYVEIKSDGLKVRFNPEDNKNVTNYISYIVDAYNSGTYNLTIDAYAYGRHIGTKNIELEITTKYSVVVDAFDGFYNSFTSKYEYVFEYGKEFILDADTYMAYKNNDEENCKFFKLEYYVDESGHIYHLGDSIIINKSIYLTAYYTSESYDIDIDDGGTMYLTEVDIFHNEEYYNKYHKDKVIYPGAKGSHVMTITNTTKGDVSLNKLNIDEDTHCVNNNCINMAYIVKHIVPDEDHDKYYYGADNKYTILNKDVSNKKFIPATGKYEIRKEIALGDGIKLAPGEAVEIALLWRWDDSDDVADTAIGTMEGDVNYQITVSIDYTITNNACSK